MLPKTTSFLVKTVKLKWKALILVYMSDCEYLWEVFQVWFETPEFFKCFFYVTIKINIQLQTPQKKETINKMEYIYHKKFSWIHRKIIFWINYDGLRFLERLSTFLGCNYWRNTCFYPTFLRESFVYNWKSFSCLTTFCLPFKKMQNCEKMFYFIFLKKHIFHWRILT